MPIEKEIELPKPNIENNQRTEIKYKDSDRN